MFRRLVFILAVLLLTVFSVQKTFALNPQQIINPNLNQLLASPTPTPKPTLTPIRLPFFPIGTVSPSTTPMPTPTPSVTPTPTNAPTETTTPKGSPTESVAPTTQVSPSVSPTPTSKPNQQQTLVAGFNKETLVVTTIIILIIVIIFLTRWNIIKKWLNRKTA